MPGDMPADDNEVQTRRAIADEAGASEADKRDSQLIYDALRRHKGVLAGESRLPAEDRALSDRILNQARNRSAEIRAARSPSSRHLTTGTPLPWWLILAWVLVAVGMAAAWVLF